MSFWQGEAVRTFLIAMALALSGCASQLAHYVRTDGAPVDAAQEQATMAQCKGEASTTVRGVDLSDPLKRDTIISACMARNGYIQAQQ
jgi:uncharacterized lipoprotein YmbA